MSVSSTALLTDTAIAGHGPAVIALKYLYNGRSIGNDYSVRWVLYAVSQGPVLDLIESFKGTGSEQQMFESEKHVIHVPLLVHYVHHHHRKIIKPIRHKKFSVHGLVGNSLIRFVYKSDQDGHPTESR
ncbi:hypothetical protein QTP88_025140 [Uroleucon formosanum]